MTSLYDQLKKIDRNTPKLFHKITPVKAPLRRFHRDPENLKSLAAPKTTNVSSSL